MKKSIFIINLNKHKFVCGLTWKILAEPRNPMKQAQIIGKAEGMDLVAFRKASILQQAGFLSKKDDAAPGMFSLALVLASILGNNWIGIFKLPDHESIDESYAFIAVLDGNIVPQSDFIGSKEEVLSAKNKLKSILKNNNHCNIYLPKNLEEHSQEKNLDELLISKNLKKEHKIKSLTFNISKNDFICIGITVAVFLSLLTAVKQWKSYQLDCRKKEFLRSIKTEESEDTIKTIELTNSLDTTSQTNELIRKIYQGLYQSPISISGWMYSVSHCQQGSITYSYQRTTDSTVTIDEFSNIIHEKYKVKPRYSIINAAETAEFTVPLEMECKKNTPVDEITIQLKKVISIFQKNKIKATFSNPEKESEYLPDSRQNTIDELPLKKYHFVYETDIPPHIIFGEKPLNGVRLTSVKTALDSESGFLIWSIEGDIYGK